MTLRATHRGFSVFVALLIALLHAALASVYIEHPPQYDEMYHMLAADSWRTTGELRILDGEYTRASLFTKLVAMQSYLCGRSLECARTVSIVASTLLIFAVIVFASLTTRPAVGVVTGLFVALNPAIVTSSQQVRFYSLHALLFMLIAIALYTVVVHWGARPLWKSILGIAGVLPAIYLANHLQVTTQVGLLALAAAVFVIGATGLFRWLSHRSLVELLALGTGFLVICATTLYLIDISARVEKLRWTPGWAAGLEQAYLYYHYMIEGWYPAVWRFAAFFAVLSIARWPRLSLYCLTTFVVCFAILSVAGTKASRYIVFALPFFFIPISAGMVVAFDLIAASLARQLRKLPWRSLNRKRIPKASIAITLAATFAYVAMQPVVRAAGRMITKENYEATYGGYEHYSDWPAAAASLRQLLPEHTIILSSSGVKAAYYLGDFSFELNHSIVLETLTRQEFGLDPRTGRKAVSSRDSLATILSQCGPALVIVESHHANKRAHVPPETIGLLNEMGQEIKVPADNLKVWSVAGQNDGTDCLALQARLR